MPTPNRRFTPAEFAEELDDAKHWHRPPRSFIKDIPTYPWMPKPYSAVNFDLNFCE